MAAATAPLILYSAKVCPWAQRATLALKETGLEHSVYEIDLQNKPSWYNEKINPASKVPVLQIGGEDENSSGDSVHRIPESAVLLELISDLAPSRGGRRLTSDDPIETAEARYFVERFSQVLQSKQGPVLYAGDASKIPELKEGVQEFEKLLKKRFEKNGGGPFWHGKEPGLADLAIAPFIGRLAVMSAREANIEPLASSDFHQSIYGDNSSAPVFKAYTEAILARPSWNATFDQDYIVPHFQERLKVMRAAAKK